MISYNENNESYATSLTLQFPNNREVTPIQLEKIAYIDEKDDNTPQPASIIPFAQFEDYTVTEGQSLPPVRLDPGDSLVLVTPDSNGDEQIINYVNPTDTGTTSKVVKFLQSAKYAVIKATELTESVGGLALKIYDVYNKISMGIPKWLLPMVMPAIAEVNGVQIMSDEDAENSPLDQTNFNIITSNCSMIFFTKI